MIDKDTEYSRNLKTGDKFNCICHICKKRIPQWKWGHYNSNIEGRIIANMDEYTILVYCKPCWNFIRKEIIKIFLTDRYIIQRLQTEFHIKAKKIKVYPELIENYRIQIRTKNLIKTKKNENNETS